MSRKLGRKKVYKSGSEREEIDKELNVLQRVRFLLRASERTGLFYYKNAKDLIDRLGILMEQITAGNDSIDIQNEALTTYS
jgi:hypothetical protein